MGIIKIILAVILPLYAFCQAPFKTNLITIPVKDTTFLYYKVTTILKANGYRLEKSGINNKCITTEPKVINEGITMNISVLIDSSGDLNVKGHTFIPNVGISLIENLGMRGSPAQLCWKEMDKTARQMGKNVKYKTIYIDHGY